MAEPPDPGCPPGMEEVSLRSLLVQLTKQAEAEKEAGNRAFAKGASQALRLPAD